MTTQETKAALDAQAPFPNLLRALRAPIDPSHIKQREGWTDYSGNKHMVDYVEWHTVADLLDQHAPTWQHRIRTVMTIADVVTVIAAITIDGITREGIGTGQANSETGIKKAEHDALKRAAIKFGIARDLYHRDRPQQHQERPGQGTRRSLPNPAAISAADFATNKQIALIQRLCGELGVDADTELHETMKLDCTLAELSRRAASSFIDHLQALRLR